MGSSQAIVWVFALVLSSPLAAREYLPHHSASRSHRGSLLRCLDHCFPLLPFSPQGFQGCLSHFSPHLQVAFCPSLHRLPKVLPSWPQGSAVPCSGWAGAGSNRTALASPYRGCPAAPMPGHPRPVHPVTSQTSDVTSSI